jgi:hypothetical protein
MVPAMNEYFDGNWAPPLRSGSRTDGHVRTSAVAPGQYRPRQICKSIGSIAREWGEESGDLIMKNGTTYKKTLG